jgi:ABC-type branched-subunit amino acid transport system substrate-binding protein
MTRNGAQNYEKEMEAMKNQWERWLGLTCGLVFALLTVCSVGHAADPYIIGALWDVTGHSSIIGAPSKEVTDIWVKEVNESGGINGHPVKVVT